MTSTGSEGWFTGRFQVKSPGDYNFELKVEETGDSVSGKFTVKESDPELDNTRPDFEALFALAGNADDVLARLTDEPVKAQIKERLSRPRSQAKTEQAPGDAAAKGKDGQRLYFDLKDADIIPSCLVAIPPNVQQNRGPVDDIWQWSFTLDRNRTMVVLIVLAGLLLPAGFILGATVFVMWLAGACTLGKVTFVGVANLALMLLMLLLFVGVGLWVNTPVEVVIMTIMVGVFLLQVLILGGMALVMLLIRRPLPTWLGSLFLAGVVLLLFASAVLGLRLWVLPTPMEFAYVLLAVVGILSLEWMTRKLLKLA